MSRRRTHVRVGFVGATVVLIGIAIAGYHNPTLPVLAGATQLYCLPVGTGLALACGWAGARLPDWIEPAHIPHHRGFWHSKILGGGLLILAGLLGSGTVLGQSHPAIFLVRVASLFLAVGYLTHLGLDLLSEHGLPRLRNPARTAKGLSLPSFATTLLSHIGLGILAVGVARVFWVFGQNLAAQDPIWQPLLLGIGIGGALDHFVLYGRAQGLHTFVHEAAHAVVALLLGHRINRFICTRDEGGLVQHQCRFGGEVANTIITLAPYFCPTFAVITVIIRPLIASEWFPEYDLLIGAMVGFHLVTSLRDLRRGSRGVSARNGSTSQSIQTDISRCGGLLVSSVYISIATLITHSLLIAVIVRGYAGLTHWVEIVAHGVWLTVGVLEAKITDAFPA